jgi:transposase
MQKTEKNLRLVINNFRSQMFLFCGCLNKLTEKSKGVNMATLKDYRELTSSEKRNRHFSEEFKRKIVDQIDRNILSLSDICQEYGVSRTSVYNWQYKYSRLRKKGMKQVIESDSAERKLSQLREEIKELHRIIGGKQIELDFLTKQIDMAEEEYGVDIKKKFGTKHLSGSGTTENPTNTK